MHWSLKNGLFGKKYRLTCCQKTNRVLELACCQKTNRTCCQKTNRVCGWQKSSLAVVSEDAHDVADNLLFYFLGEVEFPPYFRLSPNPWSPRLRVELVLLSPRLEVLHAVHVEGGVSQPSPLVQLLYCNLYNTRKLLPIPTQLTPSKSSGVQRMLLVEILPNPTRLTPSKASGLRAFTVQNPVNSTRFAWSQTNFLSNSDQ